MINRIGIPIDSNSCALILQITEQEREVLDFCMKKSPFLAKYYFMQMFELTQCHEYDTGMNNYIVDLEIGDEMTSEKIRFKLYPVRATLRISLDHYDRFRQPFRNQIKPLPEYIRYGV